MVEERQRYSKSEEPTQTRGQLMNGEMQIRGDGWIEGRPVEVWLWESHPRGGLKNVLKEALERNGG